VARTTSRSVLRRCSWIVSTTWVSVIRKQWQTMRSVQGSQVTIVMVAVDIVGGGQGGRCQAGY
jgi:hypothetical protein